MNLKRRIGKLEEDSQAPGGFEVVGMGEWQWTEEQLEQAAAEAQERVGPAGTVIRIAYVTDWRGARDAAGFPVGRPGGEQ